MPIAGSVARLTVCGPLSDRDSVCVLHRERAEFSVATERRIRARRQPCEHHRGPSFGARRRRPRRVRSRPPRSPALGAAHRADARSTANIRCSSASTGCRPFWSARNAGSVVPLVVRGLLSDRDSVRVLARERAQLPAGTDRRLYWARRGASSWLRWSAFCARRAVASQLTWDRCQTPARDCAASRGTLSIRYCRSRAAASNSSSGWSAVRGLTDWLAAAGADVFGVATFLALQRPGTRQGSRRIRLA